VPLELAVVGVGLALALYLRPAEARAPLLRWPVVEQAYALAKRLWFFDDLGLAAMYVFGLGPSFVVAAFDRYVVDGLVNGTATLTLWFGRQWRRLATGNAQAYMLTLAVAVALGLIALQALGG